MKIETLNSISRFFRYALLIVAALYVAVYLVLVYFRIQYPFELEWMEGGSVHQITRILSGQKLYVSPSLEFVPYIYAPLYFYISALVAKIIGVGFIPLRLVSFIASLGCFFMIFLFVKRETKSFFFGIIAAGLFAATFQACGAFFDIARVDTLFLLLLLTVLYLIKFKQSSKSYILAGLLISLAFLTKQTALFMAIPIAFYCVLSNWRRSIFFIATAGIVIPASIFILDYIHQGWFSYYIFELPSRHSVNLRMYTHFWTADIIKPLPIAFAAFIFYIFVQFSKSNKKNWLFYSIIAVSVLGLSWMARLNRGGFLNALIPAYAVISILFGLSIHTAFQLIQIAPEGKQKLQETFIYLVCIVQFALLFYNPRRQVPTQEDLNAGRQLVSTIQQIKGDVFVPCHGYLPVLADKPWFADESALTEIVGIYGGGQSEEGKKFMTELVIAIKEKRFGAIIIDVPTDYWLEWLRERVEQYYILQQHTFYDKTRFWPVTGRKIRPQFIYFPKE